MIIPDFITKIIENGVTVEVFMDMNYGVGFNLNTGMKSECKIFFINGEYVAHMRYNETEVVENYESLLYIVKGCMCGRDYANIDWFNIFEKEGLLEKTVTTTISYS